MKNNKFATFFMTILIIAIITVFGFLVYRLFTAANTVETGNENTKNNVASNSESNITNAVQVENSQIRNSQSENQTIVDPIIQPIVPSEGEEQGKINIATNYYYNQLDENAKILYDGLKTNKSKLVSGNYIIDYGTKFNTLLNTDGGEQKLKQAFQSAWNAFSYDNVDLFYIDITKVTLLSEYTSLGGIKTYKVTIGPGENNNYFQPTFKSKEEVEAAQKYLENIKTQMIQQTANDTVYNKIAKVHNWLIYFISYEEDMLSKDPFTIYGALKNGKAVCEGYSRAFKYLMDALEVPCVLVSGTATNSQGQTENHAWNDVQLDERWYAIDVTWDDPIVEGGGQQTDKMKYQYFLKGSSEFYQSHTENGQISENSMVFQFPTLPAKDYEN